MRNLHELDKYRQTTPRVLERFGSYGDETCGVFELASQTSPKTSLFIIAASGEGWDHCSVSAWERGVQRIPSWLEMEQVKRLFFRPEETAMQLHVPTSDHISHCPYALHLWAPQGVEIPRPPGWMVGPQ